MKITKDNFKKVMNNFIDFIESQEDDLKDLFIIDIEDFFNDLLSQDAFGTEGQFDPRGDRRDND
ncbi:MAG: hypothetical protein ACFFG0_02275 [Candidatus Thorarchaeota archaeon]